MDKKKDFAKNTLRKVSQTNIIAWEKILSKLLSLRSRSYCLKKWEPLITVQNRTSYFERFEQDYGYLGRNRILVGRFTDFEEDIQKVQELLYHVYHYVQNPRLCEMTTAEILSKVLAYRNIKEGMEIRLPMTINHQLKMVTYRLDQDFNLWNSMRAFGFIPIQKRQSPPLLVFRGTEFNITTPGGRTSMVSNFDPEGPGMSVYLHARPKIRKWLKHACDSYGRARALGYSLGGALASYALIYDSEFFVTQGTAPSFLFHQPGISEKLFSKWEEKKQKEKPLCEGFVAQGDFVSKYGKLFSKTYQMILKDSPMPPIESHTALFLIKRQCNLVEIDRENENISHSRKAYSSFHENTSKWMYRAGIRFLLPSDAPPSI